MKIYHKYHHQSQKQWYLYS